MYIYNQEDSGCPRGRLGGGAQPGEEWEGTEVSASASHRAVGLTEAEGTMAIVCEMHL